MDFVGIATSLIGVISLVALVYQSYNLRVTINNQIYQSFITNSVEIDKTLIDYPQIRKYVYDNAPLPESQEELDRILSTMELIVDITENIEVYNKYIPKIRREGWMRFVHDVQKTNAYRYYMNKYGKWFELKQNLS